jgi:ribosomal protein S18 acetylase RimI-like enzyme
MPMSESTFELRPFAMPEAETIAGWATDAHEVRFLTGTDDFPLMPGDVAAWTYEADYALTLRRGGDLAAYAEIVEDVVEQDIEIQHLLVAPDLRSVGVGRAMLLRCCAFLSEVRAYPEVWLRVSRDNAPAAACASAAGFETVSQMSGPRYLWMKKVLMLNDANT